MADMLVWIALNVVAVLFLLWLFDALFVWPRR